MKVPICNLMRKHLGVNIIAEEFSAGYGVADIVGGSMCQQSHVERIARGFASPLDQKQLLEVLLILKHKNRYSPEQLSQYISFSTNLLKRKILPQMVAYNLITFDNHGYIHLLEAPPQPTKNIIAIEAKQIRWVEAILQARRYTFFANQTYVAVWHDKAKLVDRKLLYRHRLGLIGVGRKSAELLINAPYRIPRQLVMHRYCSEALYRIAQTEQNINLTSSVFTS